MLTVEQRRIWAVDLKMKLVMVGLLVMVEYTMQLKSSHPMHGIVDRINEIGGPYIGLVMAYPTEELALTTSGLFVHNSDFPWVDLAGRRFNIGKIKNADVIYVMTGEQTLNAGITVQILLDTFDTEGVVHYGIAGSTNDSLSLADVSVMKYVAFTSSWKLKEFKSETGQLPELKFGAFNYPERGENLLAKVEFTPGQLYSEGKPMEEFFWLQVDSDWFSIATQLQDLELQRCLNDTYCLPETPKVTVGLRGSTADIFLDNEAYRKFLYEQLNVSTVDEESAAIVMTCMSNGVPSIVFRGVSDLAGGGENVLSLSLSSLASVNALTAAVEFIALVEKRNTVHNH
ncbi:bark storage protein A-like [Melia azedarach]|uniref:Bark storage protein A-like n=1 Tax=Melia azedarach TaxID=155640 RepID=A0ACC1YD36_MELAZ|nr:bark storage protein A-like [Melia azedarach]